MAYDSSMDRQVFSETVDFESSRITVSIYSYNNGVPKLQISRETMDADGSYKFAKLGRMTKEEVEKILPGIQNALKHF